MYIEKRFGRRVIVATVSTYSSETFFAYGAIRENYYYLEVGDFPVTNCRVGGVNIVSKGKDWQE